MNEINVNGHRDTSGLLRILSVEREGETQRVESTGRRWEDKSGEHVLVMLFGGEVLHLIYKKEVDRWYTVMRGKPPFQAI